MKAACLDARNRTGAAASSHVALRPMGCCTAVFASASALDTPASAARRSAAQQHAHRFGATAQVACWPQPLSWTSQHLATSGLQDSKRQPSWRSMSNARFRLEQLHAGCRASATSMPAQHLASGSPQGSNRQSSCRSKCRGRCMQGKDQDADVQEQAVVA